MRELVLAYLFIIGALLILLRQRGAAEGRRNTTVGLLLIATALVLTKAWIEVPPATVAALYDPLRGGIQPYDLGEGWHIVPPWATVRYFSVRIQNYTMSSQVEDPRGGQDESIVCQTSEGLSVSVDASVLFHISPGDANRLWKAVGPRYVDVIVRPNAREATRIVIAQYPIMSVYSNAPATAAGVSGVDFFPGKRQEVADRIRDRLAERLKEKGITLDYFLLRNVDFIDKNFEQAIVAKQVAQQRIITQQYEAEVQRIRAMANIKRAEGDAESIRLRAQALRVNPAVIRWEFVKKLPDDVEVVILPDRVMPLVNLPESLATEAPLPRGAGE
ncbi:MAG: prohibitin family protein [Armatimonadetes bacterium]|nr:prohibitin family protein [Armatimonadota bacterium]